jgi:alanine-glyoxylate transaminase / (R)-3-amino-2-methylpropionate-pyruvate transaminase
MFANRLICRLFSTLQLPSTSHSPRPFDGNAEEILAKRSKHFSSIYQTHYKTPLIITEGHLQYLYDHRGNRYIDLEANDGQANIGHSHPAIKKVIQDQAGRLIHTSTIYMN